MPMASFVSEIIQRHGTQFSVVRGSETHSEKGAPNEIDGVLCFCFCPSADIRTGDLLINPAGDEYFAVDVETKFDAAVPAYLKVVYKTAAQMHQEQAHTVFNIQNAYGSVIGNSNQATINYNSSIQELKERVSEETSNDKEELEKIVALLEMVVNDQVPPSKGLFSKFSAVMERNSWISSSVASAILSWLLTQIH